MLSGLFLQVLMMSSIQLCAQKYKVNLYAQEHGLQNELVKSIAIDSMGLIWAATDYGIMHFNGERFIEFEEKLPSNYIKSVISTRSGRLFVNSDLGFGEIKYTDKKTGYVNILGGGTNPSDTLLWYPKQLFEDSKQNLWFSDNSAVYRYNNGKLHRYYLGPENTTGSYVHSFSFVENGFTHLILVSYTGNFYRYDYLTDKISPIAMNYNIHDVTGLQKISNGHVLIGFGNKLGELFFNPDSECLGFNVLSYEIDASSFLKKEDGAVFIGTWTKGLWEASLKNGQIKLHQVEEVNMRGAINQLLRNNTGYMLATDYGILVLQNQEFSSPFDRISNKYIQDIETDIYTGSIVFTDGENIYSIDEETLVPRLIFSSPGYLILQVLPDYGAVWFSDNRGVIRRLTSAGASIAYNLSGYGGSIYNMIFDAEGNMWLCQDNLAGVIRISPRGQIKLIGAEHGLNTQANFVKRTPYHHLLLGTNIPGQNLLYFDSLNDTILNMSVSFNTDTDFPPAINDAAFDEKKVLWLATNQGLYKRKGNEVSKVDLENIKQPDIKAIAIDKGQNIWIASSTGVSKFDGRYLIPFGQQDGLPSKITTYRSLVIDTKNRVWTGTIAGIAFSSNKNEPAITTKPQFISITEKGMPLTSYEYQSFNNQTYLGFKFVSTEYPTDGVNYMVKMSRKDEDWKLLIGRNEIYYTDLKKGDYELLVKARQRGNFLWSQPLVYRFSIHTVWYQSWITWSVFALVFIASVYQLTKWRNRRLEWEKTKLNRLVRERTSKLEATTREIEAKNKQLIQAKEEAERSSRAKADFLSTMSHEIRTPLNGVLGMIDILQMEHPREDQMDKIATMKFSAENLLALINDILDFSKIDEGKLQLEHIEFNLPQLATSLKKGFEPAAASKNVKLLLEQEGDIPDFVMGDPARLSQVLGNLLGNAIKFTEKGEVKILLKGVDLKNQLTEVTFSIIDTGIGISHDMIDHIFDSFSQASSDTTRKYGGSGLGLAITKKLLEIMGTRIQVKSKLGIGSEFSFKIKFEKSDGKDVELPDEVQKKSTRKTLKGVRILLVEDNQVNARIATQIMEKWGIKVDVAGDGQMAIDKYKPERYDMIFMDLHMPNVDGFEATKAIRKQDKKIPIVALTAAIKVQDKEKVLKVGMNEFVSKPFKPAELQSLIQKFALGDDENNSKLANRPEFESLKGYRVLLVEDNDINIKIASQFLEKWDLEVEVAKDGQIAVSMFHPDKYHLVLMDLHLPNMDGYQATEAIRKQDQNIPIIALTAAVKIQEKEKVLASGMNDFISKPFKPRELYNKITSNLLNATLRAG